VIGSNAVCGFCKFYEPIEGESGVVGHCVRYAPHPVATKAEEQAGEPYYAWWPVISRGERCGEFVLDSDKLAAYQEQEDE
jgi:hypothetical protein